MQEKKKWENKDTCLCQRRVKLGFEIWLAMQSYRCNINVVTLVALWFQGYSFGRKYRDKCLKILVLFPLEFWSHHNKKLIVNKQLYKMESRVKILIENKKVKYFNKNGMKNYMDLKKIVLHFVSGLVKIKINYFLWILEPNNFWHEEEYISIRKYDFISLEVSFGYTQDHGLVDAILLTASVLKVAQGLTPIRVH